MRNSIYLLLLIIILPLIIVSANENIESEIIKEWRVLNSKPRLSPGKTPSISSKNSIEMSMFLNKVSKNWNKLSFSTQNLIKPILLRPTDLLYVLPGQNVNINVVYNTTSNHFDTTNFKIFYAAGGKDAPPSKDDNGNGTPDFVEIIADAFESSYAAGITNKHFSPPPDDQLTSEKSVGDNNGGDSRYDVYLKDIGTNFTGTFGWTQPEGTPNNQNKDYIKYSFIVMDNDYATAATQYNPVSQYGTTQSPEDFARITAAHEFFHAIQYSYNQNVDNWFLEASSVWFEDFVFPNINDYIPRYLKGESRWFSAPETPLDYDSTSSSHKYGSGIWPIFLENNYPGIVKDFFVDAGNTVNPNVFYILDNILRTNKSSNLFSAFEKFTIWNYITGGNYDGAYYPDGALYDTLYIYNTTSVYMPDPKLTPSGINEKIPGYMGANYLIFNGSGPLRVIFNGDESSISNIKWNASILIKKSGTPYIETTITLDSQNTGGINITSSFDSVILIPSIYETTHSKFDLTKFKYIYGFSDDTTAPAAVAAAPAVSDVTPDQGYAISLTWPASSDDIAGGSIESYDILRRASSETGFTLVGSVTPTAAANYTITNIVPENKTAFYYKIRARDKWYNYNTVGEIESAPVFAIDDIPPGPPTNIKAVDTPKDEGGSINLTWNKSADDGKGINDVSLYTIFRSSNPAGPFLTTGVANPGKTIFYDTAVINNTDYYYYIMAEDEKPNLSYSDTTGPAQARDDFTPPPADFKAVGIDDRISLIWKNPTVPDFVKVFIRRKTESHPVDKTDGVGIYEGTDSTLADNNSIIIGQTYYYSAISFDTAGNESAPDDGSRTLAAVTLKAFNYPNPTFSGKTTIRYQLENTSIFDAVLYIFDIAGELVLKADNISNNPKNRQVISNVPVYDYEWDGKNGKGRQVSSGVYIFIIKAGDTMPKKDRTGKIAVIK